MANLFDESFWDERYGSGGTVWSGLANPQLIAELSDPDISQAKQSATGQGPGSGTHPSASSGRVPKIPKTALDVGCGEGADAVWLASRGWDVTGVDISRVALQRAKEQTSGMDLAGSLTWEHHDLLKWAPPVSSFDLVSAQFMHLPKKDREPLYSRIAAAVAPGGTLLIVGHSESDIQAGARRPDAPELFFTAAEVAGSLDPKQWLVLVSASRPRASENSDGQPITIHDEVLRAVRVA